MSYRGDIRLGDTIDVKFTTRRFSTGAPFTLAGSPVISAYVDNGTTEITAGITLTVDFDGITGLNNVRVVATSGNGFTTSTNVQLVITTGTVDSVSVVGEVVAEFSIEKRSALMPTTAARTLDVSTTGEAGIDWANIGSPTTTVNLSGTSTKAVEPTVAGRTLDVTSTGGAGIDWGNVENQSTTVSLTGTSTKALEPTTAGRTLDVTATGEAGIDWANIGGPTTTQNLSGTTISTVSGNVSGNVVGSVGSVTGAVGSVTGNVGGNVVGSVASVTGNVGGNVTGSVGSVATGGITRASFSADSGHQTVRSNTAQAGAATSITLDSSASATNDIYNQQRIYITGGVGVGQSRKILDYVGSSKVATVRTWVTNPDNTSTFAIIPEDSVWDDILADHLTSGSTGAALNAAGSAGDPWNTSLPGAYGAGTAGFIVGTNLDALVSSRLAPTTSGRTLDVTTTGGAGIDWGNIENQSTTVNLTNTTIKAVTDNVNAVLANTAHGGAAAVLTLERAVVTSTTTDEPAVKLAGNGAGAGLKSSGGSSAHGMELVGNATTGAGLRATGGIGASFNGSNSNGFSISGLLRGIHVTTSSGDTIVLAPTSGHGLNVAANGTDKHGFFITGGTAGTSDGIKAVAGTGGVPIRGDITGNITGTLTTVTNLTNLPSIPNNWLTAAGIAASALNGKGDWLTSAGYTAPDNTSIAFLKNVLEGDETIDTAPTPWERVVKIKSTSTELVRKKLRDVNGNNITATSTVIGRSTEA